MNVWATYDEIDSSNRSSYLQQTAINTDEYLAKKQTDTSEAMSIMPLIEGQGVSLLNKGVEVGMGKLKTSGWATLPTSSLNSWVTSETVTTTRHCKPPVTMPSKRVKSLWATPSRTSSLAKRPDRVSCFSRWANSTMAK